MSIQYQQEADASFGFRYKMITLRPITPEDGDFLRQLYQSARQAEFSGLGWDEVMTTTFLTMQFQAQTAHFQQTYVNSQFQIVLLDKIPIGRFYIAYLPQEIRLVDITLLPNHQGQGIGTTLLNNLLTKAKHETLPVRLHVEKHNPALRLYSRIGFRAIEDRDPFLFMEWSEQKTNKNV